MPPKYLCRSHHRGAVEYARSLDVELICRPLPAIPTAGVPVTVTEDGAAAVEVGAKHEG
jgi:hypothetical protein